MKARKRLLIPIEDKNILKMKANNG